MSSFWDRVRTQFGREPVILVSIAVVYVVTGRAGLAVGYLHPAVSTLFPPAGIALGALLVLGYRVWPVIWLAGTLLYSVVLGVVPAAPILAAANTVEALFLAYLINRFAGGRHALQTLRHALRFVGLTALTAATCATVATFMLVLLGLVPWTIYDGIWMSWTLGNFAGTVLAAPLVLLFAQGRAGRWNRAQVTEATAVFVSVVGVGLVAFCGVAPELRDHALQTWLCCAVLLWPAFRLGRGSAALGLLVLLGLATVGTLAGYGPFVRNTPASSIALVVLFMSLMALTVLIAPILAPTRSPAEST